MVGWSAILTFRLSSPLMSELRVIRQSQQPSLSDSCDDVLAGNLRKSWSEWRFWGHTSSAIRCAANFISIPKPVHALGSSLLKANLKSARKSFGVECFDWIDVHGTQRRDITG